MGVEKYDAFVSDGHTLYFGADGYEVQSEPKYALLDVAEISDAELQAYLKSHQHGQTNYPTFCNHAAETSVEKWTVDMNSMTCTYYVKTNNSMLEEKIAVPQ